MKGRYERKRPNGRLQSLLFHALILFDRFGRDRGRGFRAVAYLRVGGGGGDRPPCLA